MNVRPIFPHQRRVALAFSAAMTLAGFSPVAAATAVPAQARVLMTQGLAIKATHPQQALRDFEQAARLAPAWEPPLYQAGIVLSVVDFPAAVPMLQKAAKVNPADDTVWNILGWGYYVHHQFPAAIAAFRQQLTVKPTSPQALWGLANCYANSNVRSFAMARDALDKLLPVPSFHVQAAQLLAALPPAALDPTVDANAPITYEDAIGMLLSYRAKPQGAPISVKAANGQPPSRGLRRYVAWAAARNLLARLTIPSFQIPASRMDLATLVARYYGINDYDYIRPFPLTDMGGYSANNIMQVNSLLALRIFTQTAPNRFNPSGTMSRAAFATTVAQANQTMKTPLSPKTWLTPAAPAMTQPLFRYFFTTSVPSASLQEQDFAQHRSQLGALGFTGFPFIADARSLAAAGIAAQAGDRYLVPTLAVSDSPQSLFAVTGADGVGRYLVLGNYNQKTNASDPALVHQLLSHSADLRGLAQEVVRMAHSLQMNGITVDLENLWPTDRQNLVDFVRTLSSMVNLGPSRLRLHLMVCLPEQTQDNPHGAYDYAALAKAADQVMLITYDEHTPASAPGPITDIANTDRVIKYALTQIPREKLLLGMADYGYDWSGASALEISMNQALALARQYHAAIHWDGLSQAPHFTYTDTFGVRHTVWFSDGQSAAAAMNLVQQYGLAGVAIWHFGQENTAFWQALSQN